MEEWSIQAGCKLHRGRHQQSHNFRALPVVAVLKFVVYIFGFRVLWVCLKNFCRSKSGCLQSKEKSSVLPEGVL
ncbi:hypothetical protein V5799_003299, partial [Amblyomma americanum]